MTDAGAIARLYDRWVGPYDLVAKRTPGIGRLRTRAIEALDPAAGDLIVDVGCGSGANFPHLVDRVGPTGRVVGVDLARGMVTRARRTADALDRFDGGVLRGDAARLPIEGPVDGVIATFVVGMLDDPSIAIESWCDRLAPSGRLVLLDAAPSRHPIGRLLNLPFRGFVRATAPPAARLRYDRSPATVLGARIEAARTSLAERTTIVADERRGVGFFRLTAGER